MGRIFDMILSVAALAVVLGGSFPSGAATYYVSNAGSDEYDGETPETAWRTLGRVNGASLVPGDAVQFRRGDCWRGQLRPRSGDETGRVTYGAYGSGAKPLLLGSVRLNDPEDWVHEGENIWRTSGLESSKVHVFPSADGPLAWGEWRVHVEQGAAVRAQHDAAESADTGSAYHIRCVAPGKRSNHVQFYTGAFPIDSDALYRLAFRVRCTVPIELSPPTLMQSGDPWTPYGVKLSRADETVGVERTERVCYYRSLVSAEDARLTFFLGEVLPAGAILSFCDVSLRACDPEKFLSQDVGNIIFDNEASCGVKVWEPKDLDTQGEYWYDEARHLVKLYSTACPAVHYRDIECAIRDHIISQSGAHYVTYEGLALKYGAAHGVGGGSTHHIVVRDCDFSYIGGGDQMGGTRTVRFGNGVEFWGAAHDNLVEGCRLWEIYDAALTNQSGGPKTPQYNIVYRHNTIWNCEYSYEYWNRPEASETYEVYFEQNTCVNAGWGWGHDQRPDPSGRQLCFYTSPARARDIHVRNNIFFEARRNAFYAPTWSRDAIDALVMDRNCWFQAAGAMILFENQGYSMADWAAYQQDYGKETHSIVADPLFVNPAGCDFRLAPASPCIGWGALPGVDEGPRAEGPVQPAGQQHQPSE